MKPPKFRGVEPAYIIRVVEGEGTPDSVARGGMSHIFKPTTAMQCFVYHGDNPCPRYGTGNAVTHEFKSIENVIKPTYLDNHFCGENGGDQICHCFVDGYKKALHDAKERLLEAMPEERTYPDTSPDANKMYLDWCVMFNNCRTQSLEAIEKTFKSLLEE